MDNRGSSTTCVGEGIMEPAKIYLDASVTLIFQHYTEELWEELLHLQGGREYPPTNGLPVDQKTVDESHILQSSSSTASRIFELSKQLGTYFAIPYGFRDVVILIIQCIGVEWARVKFSHLQRL